MPGADVPAHITVADVRRAFPPSEGDPHFKEPPLALRSVANPPLQRVELPWADARPAAVLCAVFDRGGQAHVVLTRRSAALRSHTGEVAFPGGRLDPGEPAVDAALREAEEEVGIRPADVEVVGRLPPLATLSSRSAITPVVGLLSSEPVLVPNPAEVERAFSVALIGLLDGNVYHEERWDPPGGSERPVHFFALDADTVWGATARMLRELLDAVVGDGRA